MNCPNCKTFNNPDAEYCSICGHKMVPEQQPIQQPIGQTSVQNVAAQPQVEPVQTVQQNVNMQQPIQQSVEYTNNTNQNANNFQTYSTPTTNINNTSNKKNLNDLFQKKYLIILALIVIVGIGIFFLIKGLGKNNSAANLKAIFDPDKPIVVESNDKYGYITSKGKVMLEPQYKKANDFYGDYAIVTIDNPNSSSIYKDLYQIIDKKGNVMLSSESYSAPKYYAEYNVWVVDGVLYDSKLNKMLDEGTIVSYVDYGYFEYEDVIKNESGIINYKGKKVFTMPGTSISVDISKNEYNPDDLYAEVRRYGEPEQDIIVSLKKGDILFTSENVDDYYIMTDDNGIFYYYNHKDSNGYENKKYLFFINNKLAYQTTEQVYEVEVYDYKNQILKIDYGYDYDELGKKQRTYYYDVKSKKMLEQKPSIDIEDAELDLMELAYGFKEYSISGKYGLMSGSKVIVPCEYDDIDYLNSNLFNYMKSKGKELILLEKNKQLILYNLKNSKPITTFNSTYAYDYDDSTFIKISIYGDDKYTTTGYMVYNVLTGKSMTFDKKDDIDIGSNYVKLEKDGKITYYNTDFKEIYVTEA